MESSALFNDKYHLSLNSATTMIEEATAFKISLLPVRVCCPKTKSYVTCKGL